MLSGVDLSERAEALRGRAPRRSPTVRVLAAFSRHTQCGLAAAGFAAGVDLDKLLKGTDLAVDYGQSPFAFARGKTFESLLARDGYEPVFALLRENLGFAPSDTRAVNLRNHFKPNRAGMADRAVATNELLRKIVGGDAAAPNLIDGAVFETELGGVVAYFEADSLAARSTGVVYPGEVKSFPVVDGRADPEKLGAALDQASVYALLAMLAVDSVGGDPHLISTKVLLITPRNVGLTPMLSTMEVSRRIDRVEELFTSVPDVLQVAEVLPRGLTFDPVAEAGGETGRRIDALDRIAEAVGLNYADSCLNDCGLARFCRDRLHAADDPALCGSLMTRMLPGVGTMERAVELSSGATPSPGEEAVALQLERARKYYEAALAETA